MLTSLPRFGLRVLAMLALLALVALSSCSDETSHDGHPTTSGIAASEPFNQADVDFATGMIQHHAQALSMVDLTVGRDLSPQLTHLAEQVREAQAPEIETMVDWLNDWGQPVPETMRDHANAHDDEAAHEDADMPGMMTADEMSELEAAQGTEFEQLWLEMMIEHHQGAIEMATTESADGEDPDAIELAKTVIATQQSEIEEMESQLSA